MSGPYALLADSPGGLKIVDVRDPARPVFAGSYPSEARRIAVKGTQAYMAGDGLEVFDLGNPQQPVSVGRHRTGMPTYGLQVVGDLAYVASGEYGLAIYRILPQLKLNPPVRMGDSLHLSWLGAPGVRLQTTPTLLPPDWQDVPGSDGASRTQRPATNRGAFYRLVMH